MLSGFWLINTCVELAPVLNKLYQLSFFLGLFPSSYCNHFTHLFNHGTVIIEQMLTFLETMLFFYQ